MKEDPCRVSLQILYTCTEHCTVETVDLCKICTNYEAANRGSCIWRNYKALWKLIFFSQKVPKTRKWRKTDFWWVVCVLKFLEYQNCTRMLVLDTYASAAPILDLRKATAATVQYTSSTWQNTSSPHKSFKFLNQYTECTKGGIATKLCNVPYSSDSTITLF